MNHFFGNNLKTIRREKKLSQEALGKQLNKGQKTIGNWETGYSEPCLEDLVNIGAFFNIAIDVLLNHDMEGCYIQPEGKHTITEPVAENMSSAIADTKLILQYSAKANSIAEHSEIVWRDKYIAILESHLHGKGITDISQPTVQDVMTQVLAIQKMLAELSSDNL